MIRQINTEILFWVWVFQVSLWQVSNEKENFSKMLG